MVNFNCGLEGAILRPGDLVKVIDENRSDDKYSGRIIDVTTTGIYLDKNLSLDNKNYLLTVNTPTYFYDTSITELTHASQINEIRRSQIQTYEFNPNISDIKISHEPLVSGVSGDANPILGTKIDFHPNIWNQTFNDIHYNLRDADLTWSIQDTSYSENYYNVISVKEKNNFIYSVEGLEHNKEKYLAIESGITFTPADPFDPASTAAPPNPSDLDLQLEIAKDSSGGNTNTKLIKYTITKPSSLGTTNGYLVYIKEGSDWDDSDMQKDANGVATSVPKDDFLNGSLSVTINPGQTLSSFYFPRYNNTTYYFRIFSQNSIGILSTGYQPSSADHSILVQSHYPIRDVKVHSLRMAGDTSANPAGHKSGWGLATGSDFTFTWDISFANSYITNYPLEYKV
jgi:hypothetical protein